MTPNPTTAVACPPLSGQKHATVRRVFGDILESVKDADASLCYSTSFDGSPTKTERSSVTTENDAIDEPLKSSPGVVAKPFASILDKDETDKENSALGKQAIKKGRVHSDQQPGNDRKDLMRRLRKQAQSTSQRSIMATKAQDAVNKATESIHQTFNAIRKPGNKLREFKQFHADTEQNRRQLLKLQRQLSSSFRKSQAEKQRMARLAQLEAIDKESKFNSEVFREHKDALKEENDKKRRESIETRAKLRENHRQGERKMQLQRIEEDEMFFEERQLSFAASQEEKKRKAHNRRKSYQFRNGDASRIRQLYAEMEAQRLNAEHESYELKRNADMDAKEYQKQLAQQRRESLAARNTEAKRQMDFQAQQWKDQQSNEHESYELKRAAEKDADRFKKQLGDERRESLARRNDENHKQRQKKAEMLSKEKANEHESFELKRAAAKDVEAYKREMETKRRQSLASRNMERAKHAKVMGELNALAKEKETESYMLKWAGENDAKEYLAKLAKERRESLQLRNREGKAHRELDMANQQKLLEEAHADEALNAACQKDVEKYKKECADQRRASLEFRGKEAAIQRLEEEQRIQQQRDIDAANRELEDQAQQDVADYLKDCKQRRRLSLAFRAKERRRHVEWEQRHFQTLIEQRSLETEGRTLDLCHLERARHQERVRMVMDALREAGCEFDDEQFANLLK